MAQSEFTEAYDDDERALRGAILSEPISVLQTRKPVTVTRSTSIRDAVTLMHENRTGCVLVVEGEKLVGIFSERDLLGVVEENVSPSTTPVEQVMTEGPDVLRREQGIALALNKMSVGGFRHIPLVESYKLRKIHRLVKQTYNENRSSAGLVRSIPSRRSSAPTAHAPPVRVR